MTDLLSEKEIAGAKREKTKLLLFWFASLVLYLAVAITLTVLAVYFVGELRNRDYTVLLGVLTVFVSVVFFFFTLFFFSIKFRLTRKYVRMLKDMEKGLKDEIEAKFMGYDENVTMKDGVYFYAMVLQTDPLRREDITERKLLIEHTVPKIDLPVGVRLKIISHANILMSYEVA